MRIKFIVSAVVLAVVIGLALGPLQHMAANAEVGARAVAKTACSCVFVAGRTLEECRADDPPGFERVNASVDVAAAEVTASVLWLVRARAQYRGREGCLTD
ncbi:MAG: hypothetical protein Q8J92_14510 [Parvibaculum sp.]|uniref:hypothetical protein n=1 Tax=Parvibaculum sp. TaxID=2024848 RepID=UPI0027241A1F|nr:hypothetical protein [Parvibaculum sp.]MDO8837845.1 hypothetical protein [Parvibaculum sp.]MDP2125583.1 hypothetical protein [Parvibaculum sp.]